MAAPTVAGVSTTANWQTDGSIPGDLPAATATGQLLLGVTVVFGGGATVNLPSASPGAWTLESTDNGTGTNVSGEIASKVAGSSETSPAMSTSVVASQPTGGIIIAVTGWSGTLAGVLCGTTGATASTNMVAPAVLAAPDQSLVLRVYFQADNNTISTPPAGLAAVFDETTALGSDAGLWVYSGVQSGTGSTGTATAVASGSDGYMAWTIVIPPAAGGSNVTGAATAAFTFNAPASGKRTVKGSAAAAFTFNAPVVAKRTVKGSATAAFTFNGTAVGRRTVKGSTTAALTFNAPAVGRRTVKGSAAGPFTFNAPAAGTRKVLGSAAAGFTFNAPASGGVDGTVEGSATAAFTFNAPAVGRRTVKGSTAAAFTFNAPAVARRTVRGAALAAFTFNASASGRRTRHGTASAAFTFNAPASGGEVGNVARATIAAAVVARRTATSEADNERVADSTITTLRIAASNAVAEHIADSAVTARRTEAAAVSVARTQTSGVS